MKFGFTTLSLFVVFTFLSCAAKNLPTVIQIDAVQINLLCSHQTTASELANAAEKIESLHQMTLDFSKSIFDESGQIRELSLELFYEDKKLASTKAQLLNIQYRYYGIQLTREGVDITGLKAGAFD